MIFIMTKISFACRLLSAIEKEGKQFFFEIALNWKFINNKNCVLHLHNKRCLYQIHSKPTERYLPNNILKLYYDKTTYRKHMMMKKKRCYIRIFITISSWTQEELEDLENPLSLFFLLDFDDCEMRNCKQSCIIGRQL